MQLYIRNTYSGSKYLSSSYFGLLKMSERGFNRFRAADIFRAEGFEAWSFAEKRIRESTREPINDHTLLATWAYPTSPRLGYQ